MSRRGAQRLLVPCGLVSLFVALVTPNIVDSDIYHQMSLAREVVRGGRFPVGDQFSYARTRFPVVHHEWGAGVVAYILSRCLGAGGPLLLKYLGAMACGVACYRYGRRRGADLGAAVAAPVAVLLLYPAYVPVVRAHTYSLLFTVLLLHLLERDRAGDRWWLLGWLPAWVVWLNVHGGFLVGGGLLAAYWLEQVARRRPHAHVLAAGFAMLLLISANPYGLHYYGFLARATTMGRMTTEWRPLWEGLPAPAVAAFVLSLVLAGWVTWQRRPTELSQLGVLAVTGIAAVRWSRWEDVYGILWACYVPAQISATGLGSRLRESFWQGHWLWIGGGALLLAVFGPLAVMGQPWRLRVPDHRLGRLFHQHAYPVGAVEYLAQNRFRGKAIVHFEWGAYVTWKLYPDVRVSMDSRYEAAYQPEDPERNLRLYRARGDWRETLASDPGDILITERARRIAAALADLSEWRRVYRDAWFEVFARQGIKLPVVDRPQASLEGEFP